MKIVKINNLTYRIDDTFKFDKSKFDEDGVSKEYTQKQYVIISDTELCKQDTRLGVFDHLNLDDLSSKIKPELSLCILEDGDECYLNEMFPIIK